MNDNINVIDLLTNQNSIKSSERDRILNNIHKCRPTNYPHQNLANNIYNSARRRCKMLVYQISYNLIPIAQINLGQIWKHLSLQRNLSEVLVEGIYGWTLFM
ncbi:hypothetical protein RIR_jg4593.t1 [Rhizophagus irregularis DAOM 181602=DAOM 197198]|uniref:Uncharacterized protein n=1 Tax=Rhizophagus irregularis (strain DAOM 197198w) TaxID=1432141 RepID=A0A015KHT4_RHIIW|nr:hypothetical protein RirG_117570 [Rhizophagus irregularis DAOM 197198w]GBC38228.2 hypothetical protein RIR_jg4593.t1 [Rhizophagus irregularis DAOM 181602=DAOM 197198]